MRILTIETSSRRATLALTQPGVAAIIRQTEGTTGNGERLFQLLEEARAESGWARTSLDRIGVGIGPGSFTGLRAGIAFARGVALGLGRPLYGVGSLRVMASGVETTTPAPCCPLLDARRGEVFFATYAGGGSEVAAPEALRPEAVLERLGALGGGTLLGEAVALLGSPPAGWTWLRGARLDLPHAVAMARVVLEFPEGAPEAEPLYIRPVDAIRPKMPPSPLSSPEEAP